VTVGSWHKGFDRLIEAVDGLKDQGIIAEDVIAQVGPGRYQARQMQAMHYCSPDVFKRLVTEARVIIAHAGMGTIAEAISQRKPIIVVPRKGSLGEHFDDHQFATARELEAEGKVLVAYETAELPARLQQAAAFIPAQSVTSDGIQKAIEEFIEGVIAKKCR